MEEHPVAPESGTSDGSDQSDDFASMIDFHPYRDRFEAHHRIPAEPRRTCSVRH